MVYLSSFLFSGEKVNNPNIYPYNVFVKKSERLLLFHPITILFNVRYFYEVLKNAELIDT